MSGSKTRFDSQTFSILPDNVLISHVLGDGSVANRSGGQVDMLILRLFDTDNQTYLPEDVNTTLWVTWNYYAYDYGHVLQTNDTGHITFDFDPGCSDPQYNIGPQKWFAEVNTSESCYYPNSSNVLGLTVWGDFNMTIFKPDGSSNYTWGDLIFMQGQVKDDCENTIDGATVSFNMTEGTYDYGFSPSNLGGGFYQGDWDSTNASEGYYNVTMMVNKTYIYPNQTTREYPQTFIKCIPAIF